MSKKILISMALAAVLLTLAGCRQQAPKSDAAPESTATPTSPEVPDFTLNGLNGQPLRLSSLRGRYVVLDFWGSWCVWCIRGVPKMKEYYARYKEKMEIVGINSGDTEAAWREAVSTYGMPWQHVYLPEGSNLLSIYGITGFPTKIIVDPEGRLVEAFTGESDDFYNALDRLFGE